MGVDVGYRGSLESHLVVVSIGFVVVACVQMVFGWAQCRNCLARLISIPYVVRTLKGLANPKKRDAPPNGLLCGSFDGRTTFLSPST